MALLEKAGLVDHKNRVVGGKRLEDIVAHDVAQPIRIPPPAAKDRLLPPRSRIASRLRAYPPGLASLVAQQTVQESTSRSRHTLLGE